MVSRSHATTVYLPAAGLGLEEIVDHQRSSPVALGEDGVSGSVSGGAHFSTSSTHSDTVASK